MKAISIRQPWAWLILYGGKDIENRSWPSKVRGRVLIHAAKGMTRDEYRGAREFAWDACAEMPELPEMHELLRSGIVGSVEIVDCVSRSDSPWFRGPYGFVLANPTVLPFVKLKGKLGFFDVNQAA